MHSHVLVDKSMVFNMTVFIVATRSVASEHFFAHRQHFFAHRQHSFAHGQQVVGDQSSKLGVVFSGASLLNVWNSDKIHHMGKAISVAQQMEMFQENWIPN